MVFVLFGNLSIIISVIIFFMIEKNELLPNIKLGNKLLDFLKKFWPPFFIFSILLTLIGQFLLIIY